MHAFDLDNEAWESTKKSCREERDGWSLPCCSSMVIAKQSRLGTRFFAHYARNGCEWQGETEHHLRLKRLAVEAARRHGWTAETEVTGTTDDGDAWKADVLATRGSATVAVEIQWSSQTNESLLGRQARYERAGIRCLWLIRGAGYPVTQALPAVSVSEAGPGNYLVRIPSESGASLRRAYDWVARDIPAADFLDAVFDRRFRWGLRIGDALSCSVEIATIDCWRCGNKTSPVTGIVATAADATAYLSIYDFEDQSLLLKALLPDSVKREHGVGPIVPRFSKTEGRHYLSNGCLACGALLGRFFEHQYAHQATVRHVACLRVDAAWREFLVDHLPTTWRVVSSGATEG